MNDQNWFSQFVSRMTTETPVFFKKIVAFGVTVGTIGVGLVAAPASVFASLPIDLHTVGGYMIAIGTISGIVAKAATTDKSLQQEGGSNPPKP